METINIKEKVDALYYKLKHELVYKSNHSKHPFWYEVFVDFNEDFDEVLYPVIKDLPYWAAFDLCWGYLQSREDYYDSPSWIEDLNKMIKNDSGE